MVQALIGRDAELQALLTAFREGRRLVTLSGPPGIGKTSLARAASVATSPAAFCELGNAASEEALAGAVLGVLEAPDRGLVSALLAPSDRVARLLQERGRFLLVLDNFDRVAPASTMVAQWLAAAPSVVILVTSRERLALPDELVLELSPLACPVRDAGRDELLRSHAVQLFLARAHDVGAAGLDDSEAIAEVVQRLEGIPLAIELAASRARLMTPRELARRLERGVALLSAPGLLERHRTLFSAIAWSWDLLQPDERLALAVCASFEGSFSVERAEELCGLTLARHGRAPHAALDLLAQLRDKSLVRLDETGRLRIFASIREFALLRLDELGGELSRTSREDHCRSFGALAERFLSERLFLSVEPRQGIVAEARREAENIVAAHRFAEREGRAACGSLGFALTAAVALLHAVPAAQADAALVRQLARDDLTTSERAVLLLARQSSLGALGRHEEAVAVGRVALALPKLEAGLRAFALVVAGTQLRADGDAPGALRLHEQAQEVLAGRPFTRLHGMNLSCMGRLACDLRLVDRARELNTQASRACDDLGDRFLAALGLANLAQLEQEVRSFHRAEQLYLDAIDRFTRAHEPQYRGIYETRLATLYLEWSRLDEALGWLATAERSLGELHTPTSRVFLYAAWAFAEASAARADVAAKRLERARAVAQRGAQGVTGLALELLGGAVELLAPAPDATAISFWSDRARGLAAENGPRSQIQNLDARFAFRTLAHALARHRPTRGASVLRLGPDVLWFAYEAAEPVDLARRGPMRRMLAALVDARERAPGRTLDRQALFSAGWPGERVLEEAASTRVRVAVATLRKLGLREPLLTRDDGYLLDPEVELQHLTTRADSAASG